MDKSKAKKAVSKSKGRKKTARKEAPAAAPNTLGIAPGINPEIQAASISLQPADGYINPYRETGTMAPTAYTAGNMLAGHNAPQMINY
jgi:hypothetical protein